MVEITRRRDFGVDGADVVEITRTLLRQRDFGVDSGTKAMPCLRGSIVDGSGGRKAKVVGVCCGGLGMVLVVAIWLLAGVV